MENENAGLGVGHIWTNRECPAYRTLDGRDCICAQPNMRLEDMTGRNSITIEQDCAIVRVTVSGTPEHPTYYTKVLEFDETTLMQLIAALTELADRTY